MCEVSIQFAKRQRKYDRLLYVAVISYQASDYNYFSIDLLYNISKYRSFPHVARPKMAVILHKLALRKTKNEEKNGGLAIGFFAISV